MRRYRVFQFDFDARANLLKLELGDACTREQQRSNEERKEGIRSGLLSEYGQMDGDQKIAKFIDLGPKTVSVVAFHNVFSQQLRDAFIIGAFYPALTAACALGERILNHLVIALRHYYTHTPEYKRIFRKKSIDNWETAVGILEAQRVLLPEAAKAFRELKVIRDRAIHFDPKVDASNRPMALEAIAALDRVIASQFAGFFSTHWFMEGIDGVAYIRKSLEAEPFVREIYLPNAILLGANAIVSIHKSVVVVSDPDSESTNEVTDEEFRDLVLARRRALEVHHDV